MKRLLLGLSIAAMILFNGIAPFAQAWEVDNVVTVNGWCLASHTTIDQLKQMTADLIDNGAAGYNRMLNDLDNRCYDANYELHARAGIKPIPVVLTKRLWDFEINYGNRVFSIAMWAMRDRTGAKGYTWLRTGISNLKTNPGDA